MEGWLIFIGIVVAIRFIVWLNNRLSNLQQQAKKYVELKPKLDDLNNYLKSSEAKLKKDIESRKANLDKEIADFEKNKVVALKEIENKQNKAKTELESYRQKIEVQFEEKRKELATLVKNYVNSEARQALIQLAEEKS